MSGIWNWYLECSTALPNKHFCRTQIENNFTGPILCGLSMNVAGFEKTITLCAIMQILYSPLLYFLRKVTKETDEKKVKISTHHIDGDMPNLPN